MKTFNKNFLVYDVLNMLLTAYERTLVSLSQRAPLHEKTNKKGKKKIDYRMQIAVNQRGLKMKNLLAVNQYDQSNLVANYTQWHNLAKMKNQTRVFFDLGKIIETLGDEGWYLMKYVNNFTWTSKSSLEQHVKPIHLIFRKDKNLLLVEDNYDWKNETRPSFEMSIYSFSETDLITFNKSERKYMLPLGKKEKQHTLTHTQSILKDNLYLEKIKKLLVLQ